MAVRYNYTHKGQMRNSSIAMRKHIATSLVVILLTIITICLFITIGNTHTKSNESPSGFELSKQREQLTHGRTTSPIHGDFIADKESAPPDGFMKVKTDAAEFLFGNDIRSAVRGELLSAIKQIELGMTAEGTNILSSLQIPVNMEGAKGMMDVLLAQDGTAGISYPLPADVLSTLRKALRAVPDAEGLGKYMASIYSKLQESGQTVAADELLNGVAYPAMLAELAAQADSQGKSEEVTDLSDRLIASNDVGVVGAVVRLASSRPSLLNEASEALFNWSLQHPQVAQAGLFAEYLNNQEVPPEQRVVAAFGLAGLVGKLEARKALEKAFSYETDRNTRSCLLNAIANLNSNGEAPSSHTAPTK